MWCGAASAVLPEEENDPFSIPPSTFEYTHVYDVSEHQPSLEMSRILSERLGGTWNVHTWNSHSSCPRRVSGSGVDVAPGGIRTAEEAERAARAFVASNPDFFGGATPANLATHRVTNALGKWAVLLQQSIAGTPVYEAIVSIAMTESGRLYAFGANYYDDAALPEVPPMPREMAVAIARDAVPYDPTAPMQCIEDATMILPVYDASAKKMTFRLTHMTEVATTAPYGLYRTWVDAVNGDIVRRENQVSHAYSGQARGDVEMPGYCDGNVPNVPFAGVNVMINGVGTAVTNAAGSFSIAGSGGTRSFTAQFDGPYVNVNCNGCAGGDALFSGTIAENVSEPIYFSAASYRPDERDCFYFINATRNYINSIDPAWTYPKVTANVNFSSYCNANWAGTVLNFFRTGYGCHNTGEIGDVVAHEYGHCIQASLNDGGQGPNGQGEGNSDIAGTFMSEISVMGLGFLNCSYGVSCPGSSCRDCENTLRWPADAVEREIHDAGRVICGFNWDVRQAMEATHGAVAGKQKTAQMWHYSRKMFGYTGYDQDDQAFDYFVVNDNDGNLTNGTPDYAEICTGAMNHGFICPTIQGGDQQSPIVTVLAPNGGETIVLGNTVPITWSASDNWGVTTVDIFYSQNGGLSYPTTIASNQPNDGFHLWRPLSPPTNAARIRIVAADAALNFGEDQSNANFTLGPPMSGPPSVVVLSPNGGEVIDAQTARLITWSANDDIAVTRLDIHFSTDGGGTFNTVVATGVANTGSYLWSVNDLPTTSGRIRVTAYDANFQSATDRSNTDFTVRLDVTGTPGAGVIPARAFLEGAIPEPFTERTTVRFGLAQPGPVTLVVYSAEGRAVRELVSGAMSPGTWDVAWDGRDASGNAVTSGRYFLRLTTAEGTLTRNVTFLR
jgi:Zn-dependent metalloprotease